MRGLGAGLLCSFLILMAVIGYLVGHTTQQADSVRASQLAACEASLQPGGVRAVIIAQIRDEIEQSKSTPPALFPDIPKKKFKRLIRLSVERKQSYIANLRDIDCQDLYG